MNDQQIDFSSLDPSRNAKQWGVRIDLIAERATRNCIGQFTVVGQLLAWSKPMFAVAASIALAASLSMLTSHKESPSSRVDPAATIAMWAANDEVPNTETVLVVLGGSLGKP
jgi:hypothetical protein